MTKLSIANASGFADGIPNVFVKEITLAPASKDESDDSMILDIKLTLQARLDTKIAPSNLFIALINEESQLTRLKGSTAVLERAVIYNESRPGMEILTRGLPSREKEYTKKKTINYNYPVGIKYKDVRIKAKIASLRPSFLALYCIAYLPQSETDTKSAIAPGTRSIVFGQPAIERIFSNGVADMTARVWTLKNTIQGYGRAGEVWPGPVHQILSSGREHLMAGQLHTGVAHPQIRRSNVSNQKIKDLRFQKSLDALQMDNFLSNLQQRRRRLQRAENHRTQLISENYFSPIQYSRSTTGAVNLFFSFDFMSFISQNVKYAQLFQNKESLQSCMEIREISLFRRRTERGADGNRLTPDYNPYNVEKSRASDTMVASLSSATIQKVNVGDGQPTQNFIAADASLSSVTAGNYEYDLEFEVIDHTGAAIRSNLSHLNNTLSEYRRYLSIFNKGDKSGVDSSHSSANNSEELEAESGLWKDLINSYLANLVFIFGSAPFDIQNIISWKKNLVALVNPQTATPESVAFLDKLISQFLSVMTATLNPSTQSKGEGKFSVKSKVAGTSSDISIVKYRYVIPTTYTVTGLNKVGVDYLDEGSLSSFGTIPQLSFEDMETRIAAEIQKYPVTNDTAATINEYGFLSPVSLNTLDNIINLGAQTVGASGEDAGIPPAMVSTPFQSSVDLLHAKLSADSADILNFLGSPDLEARKLVLSQDILGLSGVSIEPWNSKLSEMPDDALGAESINPPVDSKFYLGEVSKFTTASEEESQALSGSSEVSQIIGTSVRKAQALSSPIAEYLLESSADQFKEVKETNLESISGSLAYDQLKGRDMTPIFKKNNSFARNMNYNSLVTVETLEDTRQGDSINQKWIQLTKDGFDNLKEEQAGRIVRLMSAGNITNTQNIFETTKNNTILYMGLGAGNNQADQSENDPQELFEALVGEMRFIGGAAVAINVATARIGVEYTSSPAMIYRVAPPYNFLPLDAQSVTDDDDGLEDAAGYIKTSRRQIKRNNATPSGNPMSTSQTGGEY